MNSGFLIRFSRHAKRRIRLYKIDEKDIIAGIKYYLKGQIKPFFGNKFEFTSKNKFSKIKFPIKVVIVVKGPDVTVITAYPVKREKKR